MKNKKIEYEYDWRIYKMLASMYETILAVQGCK